MSFQFTLNAFADYQFAIPCSEICIPCSLDLIPCSIA